MTETFGQDCGGEAPPPASSSVALSEAEETCLLSRGPQKCPDPVDARGMIATEKLLDAKELAAQVSDIVADIVMSKLTAIGLTAENIKKLEKLGETPPVDTIGRGSQAAYLADAVLSKLAAIGLTEKNIKKLATLERRASSFSADADSQAAWTTLHSDDDADNLDVPSSSFTTEDSFDSSTCKAESNRQGSFSSSQINTDRLKHLVEGGPLLNKFSMASRSPKEFDTLPQRKLHNLDTLPPKKLHDFDTFPQPHNSAMQSSRQRKRAATPEEAVFSVPKRRAWYSEVDCEPLMKNDKGTCVGESTGEKWLKAGGEIQVYIPLR